MSPTHDARAHAHDDHGPHAHDDHGAPAGEERRPRRGGRDHHHHGVAAHRAGARHQRPLAISLGLVAGFLLVQVVTGIITSSLALLSDAGHMATDALGLGMALAAIHAASSARVNPQRTFGLYRLEILAALANSVLLFAVAGYVVWEAATRLDDPPHVDSVPVVVVGVLGLVVNVVAFALLRRGAQESLNLRGAYLEVVADTLGSIGVIAAAAVWGVTGWTWVDPVVGAAIGVFILPRAWRLGGEAVRVLVQAAPAGVDPGRVAADLLAIPGVVDVHDVHIWTLTSDMEVASAHVMVRSGTDPHAVLDQARHLLQRDHGLAHATLQVEPDDHLGCEEVTW